MLEIDRCVVSNILEMIRVVFASFKDVCRSEALGDDIVRVGNNQDIAFHTAVVRTAEMVVFGHPKMFDSFDTPTQQPSSQGDFAVDYAATNPGYPVTRRSWLD